MITMYDAEANSQFPPGAQAYAAYVDGHGGDQPNYAHVTAAYPAAHHLSIALYAADDADALDVETGAAAPADIPGWHARQQRRGLARPCVYANASTMQASVLPVLTAAGIARASVRLWTAHYAGEHICGPKSCGQLAVDADATQWTSSALGRQLDQSILLDDFFGGNVPPIPLDIMGAYTNNAGDLFIIGTDADGVLHEVKRTAPGVWTAPYPIAGKVGA